MRSRRKVVKYTKKYVIRPSPPIPANKHCGETRKGNDGQMYKSVPNYRGICRWVKGRLPPLRSRRRSVSRRSHSRGSRKRGSHKHGSHKRGLTSRRARRRSRKRSYQHKSRRRFRKRSRCY